MKKLEPSKEEGHWTVKKYTGFKDNVYLDSSDFTHDAMLVVHGDFKNLKEKIKYAKLIAKRLNAATIVELKKPVRKRI